MVNIYEILLRAASLKEETTLNSISPERAGGIMYDTLLALNDLWLQQGSALVISKIYASVAAMEADTAPVSDLTGKPLRPGQIVVIASSDSDNGSVYRYNGTDAPSWSLVGAIGNLTPVDSLDSDSTQLPLAAHQGKVLDGKISQLGQSIINLSSLVNEKGWINNSGHQIINDAYSLHKVLPLFNANQIIIKANDSSDAFITFATQVYPKSGDWTPLTESRIQITNGHEQRISVPSGAKFLIIGVTAIVGGENFEPEKVTIQFPTNNAIQKIYNELYGYYLIDFSFMEKSSGWIGSDGQIAMQNDSYHYVLPVYSDNSKIEITANQNVDAQISFATSINIDNSWVLVPGTTRYGIEVGTTKEFTIPFGTNYIIIGSKYGLAPSADYCTPSSVKLYTSVIKQISDVNNKTTTIHDLCKTLNNKVYGNFVVDFSLMEKVAGWIGSDGLMVLQDDSYHYVLPSSGAKRLFVASNPNVAAYFAFASAINNDGSWNVVSGTSRTSIESGTSDTLAIPEGTNYIIIGANFGTAPYIDYCTPSESSLYTSINKEIELVQDNISSLKERTIILDNKTTKFRQNGGFTFCQYNIGNFSYGNDPYSSVTDSTYKAYLKKYKEILMKCDADIISLNEYNDIFCADYDGNVMYAKDVLFGDFPVRKIGERLNDHPYFCGAIFSYRMLKNIQVVTLQTGSGRYCIISELEINGVTIKIATYHCGFVRGDNDAEALTEISEIISLFENDEHIIISADTNLIADKAHTSVFTNNGYTIANCGDFGDFETFIKTDPGVVNKCLDNIAVKGMRIANVRVVPDTDASDHLPLVCDLILTNIS